jgi:hypothetical protein
MNLPSISKTVCRVSLLSLILLISAIASCYVGQRKSESEVQKRESAGFYVSDIPIETNNWQLVGFLVFFGGFSVAIAAFMMWRQERQG